MTEKYTEKYNIIIISDEIYENLRGVILDK